MRRPRLLLLSVVLALLLWGSLVLHAKQRLGVPTRENFERVREGMTPGEVEAILGPVDGGSISYTVRQWWVKDGCEIRVEYRSLHRPRVSSKRYYASPPESIRDRLRRWLPWCERVFGPS